MKEILVVMVTHNSERFIHWGVTPLMNNEDIDLIIVDSGSKNTDYLNDISIKADVLFESNIGFVKGNNLALSHKDIRNYNFVLFLNPDARIDNENIDKLLAIIKNKDSIYDFYSIPLRAFDINSMTPKDYYDSLGIECNFYGKWQDVRKSYPQKIINDIDVFCGAFLLISTKSLLTARGSNGEIGFEEKLSMYKEDIELCLRLKKSGFKGRIIEDLEGYHCRGWDSNRRNVPFWAKYLSAKNDLYISLKYKLRALPYALAKFLYVNIIERF